MAAFNTAITTAAAITTSKIDNDYIFEGRRDQVDQVETQLRALLKAVETLTKYRKDLGATTFEFGESMIALSAVEVNKSVAKNLVVLGNIQKRIKDLHDKQAKQDFFHFISVVDEYIRVIGSIKNAFNARLKAYQNYQIADSNCQRKRDTVDRLKSASKTRSDKISVGMGEIAELEKVTQDAKKQFDDVTSLLRIELERYEKEKVVDFTLAIQGFLRSLVETQKEAMPTHFDRRDKRPVIARTYQLLKAKEMGDFLVVGVHSDAEILANKGPTVMKEQERYDAVAACKWVDLVVPDAPYLTTVAMLDKYNCDYCVHGDDITTMADGSDCYQAVKDAGRYKECCRTQGVSTTEMVGRMLLMSTDHLRRNSGSGAGMASGFSTSRPASSISHFLPTSRKIVQFSSGREPKPTDRVVYADGAFDLFHIGHIEFLKRAKEQGDYLLVGIHDDTVVNQIRGGNYPIMNVHERALSVLACKYVDEVIIGAPYSVTKDVLETVFKVSLVVHGTTECEPDVDGRDPYALPKELRIYQEMPSPRGDVTTEAIIDRIIQNRKLYEARNKRKQEKALLEAKMLSEKANTCS
ncbi:Ethanolamine-phosphate cytidylyltransferase [Irineochytrium annulatum]|nr:Ethanolamine-phosphate cytidylyltransferase [Irineochytrium annulatum]